MISEKDLIKITELPGVASVCGIPASYIQTVLPNYDFQMCVDGYLFATPKGVSLDEIRLVHVAHLDEIGGMITEEVKKGVYETMLFCSAESIAHRQIALYRYDAKSEKDIIIGETEMDGDKLIVRSEDISPYLYFFTYNEKTVIRGDSITGKALDPRAAVYCLMQVAEKIERKDIGFLFAFAEEIGAYGARKAASHFQHILPNLSAVINVDLPILGNVHGLELEDVGIRIIESGRTPIDPCSTLAAYEKLQAKGYEVKLTTARTGSQTPIFSSSWLALSIAFPVRGGHTARGTISMKAVEKCEKLLLALPECLL